MASRIVFSNHPSLLSSRRRPHTSSRPLLVTSAATSNQKLSTAVATTSNISLKPASQVPQNPSPSSPPTWRAIQGSDNWQNLVHPLHPLLTSEILRYAELVNSCYKAFDLDPSSKRYLNCKHGKSTMLRDVGMPSAGYELTKYIYATPDSNIPTQFGERCSRWIGYVAVSTDEASSRLGRRDILVSFRGTVTNTEWITNLMSSLTPARLDPNNPRPDVKVESGFLSLYTSEDTTSRFNSGSCRQQLLSEISRILSKYKNEEEVGITLAGHSMGSSLALLLGYDIAELGLNLAGSGTEVPITVYSYGGPRVGNSAFKARCEELGVKVLRVANVNDPVTKMPGVFFNEGLELPWISSSSCYAHVGVEVSLDFFKMRNPACVHDLDAYIAWLKSGCKRKVRKEGDDVFSKVRDYLASQKSDYSWWSALWQNGGRHGGELVQSPRV
ncbi:galactolipase DONGLE, chloroplastic-like [Phalaenopsis equestris]|uniref:galactolipase DONGLE, chloroplastic-like n=1 Tax=Phalaenopsis equestris TaxID=78828 RepID=UPI0009E39399|nr:galactolipase DONGLE, chloroplastic-like [Phalaenopsis equestris]